MHVACDRDQLHSTKNTLQNLSCNLILNGRLVIKVFQVHWWSSWRRKLYDIIPSSLCARDRQILS